jgi:prophage regulatory protein
MATTFKPYTTPVRDLHLDPLSQSPASPNTEQESDSQALCEAPRDVALDTIMGSQNGQADLKVNWEVTREACLEAGLEVDVRPCLLTARIRPGVTMLSTAVVYKRRNKGRSAHYEDIKAGLFIEPLPIGLRARGTPDYEVDTLIAATIAGKSQDEIRALVVKLRTARKGVL